MPVDGHAAVVLAGEWDRGDLMVDVRPREDLLAAILRVRGERAIREQHGRGVRVADGIGEGRFRTGAGAGVARNDRVVGILGEGDAALRPGLDGITTGDLLR